MKFHIVVILSLAGLALPNVIREHNYGLETIVGDDAKLPVPALVTENGYPCETHFVTTHDDYILRMHRIPHGKTGARKNKVVFLQHGILSSSADWIIIGPQKGLAYLLADQGYDVWMGNARGNHYSRNHTYMNPDKDPDFWHFSWHEIGVTDLPTMIDYVLEKTGQKQVFYVGHSQGTTSFYVMASSVPDYNSKIAAHISLAPIGFMNHMTSPLVHIMAFWQGPLSILLGLIGVNEFLPNNQFMGLAGKTLCGNDDISQFLCKDALFAICGFSPKEMNVTLLPILMGHTPAGASTMQMLHYGQEVNSGHFRQYDYGLVGNLKRYNSIFPPDYDLKKITAPVYMIYSRNDWLSSERDVIKICKRMSNCKGTLLTSDPTFNHLDYMFGIHAPTVVYKKVISLINSYH